MIADLRVLRELPLAAASGVVRVGRTIFVVADDAHELAAVYEDGSTRRLAFTEAWQGGDPVATKRVKRDIEALTVAGGALLGLGSGSTAQRNRGFAWPLTDSGEPAGEPEPLELKPLYDQLARAIPDLNIEGATFTGDALLLFQRGNGPGAVNAVVRLGWTGAARTTLQPARVEAIERYELGRAAGVRLCFTDAACAGSRVVFTAVAEAAQSTYHDGPCVGAAIGILDGPMFALAPPLKVEGVEVLSEDDGGMELLLVVDDDRPTSAAQLLAARIAVG